MLKLPNLKQASTFLNIHILIEHDCSIFLNNPSCIVHQVEEKLEYTVYLLSETSNIPDFSPHSEVYTTNPLHEYLDDKHCYK